MNRQLGALALLVAALPYRAAFGAETATVAPASNAPSDEDTIIIIDDSPPPSRTSSSSAIVIEDPSGAPESRLLDVIRARANVRLDGRFALDTSFDRQGEQVAELWLGGRLELDVELSESWQFWCAPSFQWVGALSREGADREMLYAAFPEAQVSWQSGPFSLRAGALVFSWGTSDFASPVDVLNPFDLRRSVLGLGEFAKIPVLAAEGAVTLGPLTFRGVIQPFFAASRYHMAGWDFAVLQTAGIPGTELLQDPTTFNPAFVDRIGDELLVTERPRDRPDNATLAGRITLSLGDLDLSVSGVHGWDTLPRLQVDRDLALIAGRLGRGQATGEPVDFSDPEVVGAIVRLQTAAEEGRTLLRGSFMRRNLIGLDGSFALDPFVLKFDLAYTFDRNFYSWGYQPTTIGWLMSVIGIEYFLGEELQVIVEAFAITATGIDSNVRLLYLEANTPPPSVSDNFQRSVAVPGAIGLVRYTMLDGDLSFELAVGGTFTRGDFVIFPSINWRLDDYHRVGIGGAAVEGKSDSYGGLYTHTDQLFLTYRFTY